MIKVSLVVTEPYTRNRIFELDAPVNGVDNRLHFFYMLKKVFNQNNYDIATQDINKVDESDIIIYNDMPTLLPQKKENQKVCLFAFESEAVLPDNFNVKSYNYFDKVFTWNDELIDNKKVIKINYSFLLNTLPFIDFNKKTGFICMFAANKFSNHKHELYSERVRVIEYLERTGCCSFGLYGSGWDRVYKTSLLYNFVKKMHRNMYLRKFWSLFEKVIFTLGLQSLIIKRFGSYKGRISAKIPKLTEYKFNICYENVSSVPGYITEKIFDCFLAGCVPIYLGAPNIEEYIPKNTFIDRRKFKDDLELFTYLRSITRADYLNYQYNIQTFLLSKKAEAFSSKYVANKVVEELKLTRCVEI